MDEKERKEVQLISKSIIVTNKEETNKRQNSGCKIRLILIKVI